MLTMSYVYIDTTNNSMSDSIKDYPDIIKIWNWKKNGELDPSSISIGSSKKVWWVCNKGHEWQAAIYNIAGNNSRCPYCSNRKPLKDFNSLADTHPDVLEKWNYERNSRITPFEILAGSSKKVWWMCDKGHEWQSSVHSVCNGSGCNVCAGKVIIEGFNDLATTHP